MIDAGYASPLGSQDPYLGVKGTFELSTGSSKLSWGRGMPSPLRPPPRALPVSLPVPAMPAAGAPASSPAALLASAPAQQRRSPSGGAPPPGQPGRMMTRATPLPGLVAAACSSSAALSRSTCSSIRRSTKT